MKAKTNLGLRKYARDEGVYLYEIANDWGITYPTLCVYMRKPFTEEQTVKFKRSVEKIAKQNREDNYGLSENSN